MKENKEHKEIQERNNRIALMLGLKPLSSPYDGAFTSDENTYNPFRIFFNGLLEDESWYHYPKFNSDWNWLMEAVDFIEKQNMEVSIIDEECCIIDTEKAEKEENPFMIKPVTSCYDAQTKKEAVFIAVSDFAKIFVK